MGCISSKPTRAPDDGHLPPNEQIPLTHIRIPNNNQPNALQQMQINNSLALSHSLSESESNAKYHSQHRYNPTSSNGAINVPRTNSSALLAQIAASGSSQPQQRDHQLLQLFKSNGIISSNHGSDANLNRNNSAVNFQGPGSIITELAHGGSELKYSESNPSAKRRWPKAKYIVGLDFGTTFSGFSVMAIPADGSEPRKVSCHTSWRDQPPRVASPKVPTVLNYSVTPYGVSLTHWGWTADAVPMEPHLRRVERVKLLLGGLTNASGQIIANTNSKLNPTSAQNSAYIPPAVSTTIPTPNNNNQQQSTQNENSQPNDTEFGQVSVTTMDSGLGVSRATMETGASFFSTDSSRLKNINGTLATAPAVSPISEYSNFTTDSSKRNCTTSAHLHTSTHPAKLPLSTNGLAESQQIAPTPTKSLIFRHVTLPDELSPKQVIADYLGCLKEIFLDMIITDLKSSDAIKYADKDKSEIIRNLEDDGAIVYCFTVPVFWTQAHMQVMREAAVMINLIPKANSELLTFCHEPVAAALSFVRSPQMKDRMMRGLCKGSGARALIVDAGGGTVDLFQCTIRSIYEISEVTQAAGDFFGASLVDEHFWSFFEQQIGSDAFELLQHDPELRQSYRNIMVQWDSIKREFKEDESCWTDRYTGGYKAFVLSRVLCDVIDEEHAKQLPARGSEVRITLEDLKSFFDPAVDEIVRMVGDQLVDVNPITSTTSSGSEGMMTTESKDGKKSEPIDFLFLVGGFCANQYLRKRLVEDERIRGRFKEVPTIDQPEGAVLEGAAWFAWNSNTVVRRKAGRTLGVKIGRPYDPAKGDTKEEVVNLSDPRERWTVYKRFHVFVRRGDPVDHGATYTRDNFTIMGGKPTVDVIVYSCTSMDEPRDISDSNFEIVGKVTVDLRRWSSLGGNTSRNNSTSQTNGHVNDNPGKQVLVNNNQKDGMTGWDPKRNTFRIEIEYGNVELWVRARPNGVEYEKAEEMEFKMVVAVEDVL
ncbi:hypothetical protein HK098_006168 [Nowakowskiella sp. JEL0407]|nr:hypothetical protein HK098_006168 [Nowakowskiella sp. JEL0407]